MSDSKDKTIGYFLERTARIVKKNYFKELKRIGVDLTPEQWVLVDSLYDKNGQSQTELAGASFKNPPTVSRIIDLLCIKGYTERQRFENDRRRYKIYLTPKGVKVVKKCRPVISQLRKKGWSELSDAEYRAFIRVLNQIFRNFSK